MSHRRMYMIAAVVALVLLNLWRWWPAVVPQRNEALQAPVTPTDLVLRSRANTDRRGRPVRDLFYGKVPVRASHRARRRRPVHVQQQAKIDAQASAALAAQAALKQYQLAGVTFHNRRWQALLIRGKDSYMVSPGDLVDGRYSVMDITSRSLTLEDRQTKAMVLLHLSTD